MGFFSGLISLFNYLLVLMFVFVIGFVVGTAVFNFMLEKVCPKAHMLMTTELSCWKEKKGSESAQKEEDKDGVVWTE